MSFGHIVERKIINRVYGLTYRSKNKIGNEIISNLFELLIVDGAIKCNKEDSSVNIRYIIGNRINRIIMQMYYTGKLKFKKEYLRILEENKGEELTEERIKELTEKITEVYEEIQKDYYGYESLNFREKIGYITRDIYDTIEKGNPARYIYGVIRAVKYYYDIKEGKINSLEEIVIDLTQNKYEVTKEDVDRVLRYIEELEKYII
jgi:hypothetical protein